MFNVSYDYAKSEGARRHERLVQAQRSGAAYLPRPARKNLFSRLANRRLFRGNPPATQPANAPGEPCVTC